MLGRTLSGKEAFIPVHRENTTFFYIVFLIGVNSSSDWETSVSSANVVQESNSAVSKSHIKRGKCFGVFFLGGGHFSIFQTILL